jgi:GNAT superfamily N-acetyltransferase
MLPFPTPVADDPLRIVLHEGSRRVLWPLFRLADDSALAIGEYLDQGAVHVATTGGMPVGLSQVVEVGEGAYELRSLAVFPGRRRRGFGTRLVARSASWARDRSGDRLVAGIPAAKLDALGFYQRLGFRLLRVERDAYGPEHGYSDTLVANGIRVRDRVWLELEI